ncbi:MAG: copper chaperone PCu(A)C [Pseudomonadota bacterium]|nr:copper chaperone PCu(A)C [Pseudomonadota bacterium]
MKRALLALIVSAWSLLATADSELQVENAWVREAPPSAHMMAAYMTLKNPGSSDTVLTQVDSPVFDHVMLHKSEVVDGVARMIHQDDILIPAQSSVELKPGSFHLMMPTPEKRLVEGDRVDFILTFSNGETIRLQADVRKKP